MYDDPEKLKELRAFIECERPSANLYNFVGNITVYDSDASNFSGVTMPLHIDNILLRGARLKDTEYVYGITLIESCYALAC